MLNCTHKLDENQKLNEELFKFIVKGEDIKLTPYFDIVNVPTIGVGVNLEKNSNYVFDELNITKDEDKKALIAVWEAQTQSLKDDIAKIPEDRAKDKADEAKKSNDRLSDNLNYAYKEFHPERKDDFFTDIDISKIKTKDINQTLKNMGITDSKELEAFGKILSEERKFFNNTIKTIDEKFDNKPKDLRKEYNGKLQTALNEKYQELTKDKNAKFVLINDETTNQPRNIFDNINENKQNELDSILKIGKDDARISDKNSHEYMALADMYYNGGGGLIGPNLKEALKNDNRAEAWYEIRYNTNDGDSRSKGIANRRVEESNEFGLYATFDENGKPAPTVEEAKELIRMYDLHKNDILKEEKAGKHATNESDQIYKAYEGDNSIAKQLAPALAAMEEYIKQESGKEVKLTPDTIIVGKGLEGYSYKEEGKTDDTNLKGTKGDDVIFAQKGNDTINAGNGDDVIFAGEGANTAIGGMGDDTYMYYKAENGHGEGTLTIDERSFGTKENDTLILKGFNANEARFTQNDKDLVISFEGKMGSVTIKNYETEQGKIENFQFDDGTLSLEQIQIQPPTKTLEENIAQALGTDSETLNAALTSRSTMSQEERMRDMFKALGMSDKEYNEMIYAQQNNISHPELDKYRTEEQKATLIPAENKTKNDNDDDNVHRR